MDLRTGETVWRLKNGSPALYPALAKNTTCDVAIVGGGITGALIAWQLVRAGLACVLIDKRKIGFGSTSASTALLLYELDTPLFRLAGLIGEDEAVACYRTCREAIDGIARVVEEVGENCDFFRRKSFYLAEEEKDLADLRREYQIRRKYGIEVDFLERREVETLFSFSRPGALLSPQAAEIDVVRFTDALIRRSVSSGLHVHGDTTLSHYDQVKNGIVIRTEAGFKISTGKLIFATGYESEKYLRRKIGALKSTYAIATSPVDAFPGWYEHSLIWTSARPYLYLRTTSDGRAVIGGGDVDFQDDRARDALLPEKTAFLERQLRKMFPGMKFETVCAWAGTFGETSDSLARIGSPPDSPNIWFALGYGGNGITYSKIAADIICDACEGRENPAARLFRLDR